MLVKINQKQSKAYNWNNLISYNLYSMSNYTDLTGSGFRIHRNIGIDTAVAYSVLTVLGLNLNLIPYKYL
jgi:hypothetical protein